MIQMTPEQKTEAVADLREAFPPMRDDLAAIDQRLAEYFDGLTSQPDDHNGYEHLGGLQFLRMMKTYNFNISRVQQVIKLREGEWTQDERGRWHHVRGGIKCPGTDTAHVYRWQPTSTVGNPSRCSCLHPYSVSTLGSIPRCGRSTDRY